MRLVTKQEDLLPLLKQAQQEAEAAFGNGACYIERYVQNPRHIEFQVCIAEQCMLVLSRNALQGLQLRVCCVHFGSMQRDGCSAWLLLLMHCSKA